LGSEARLTKWYDFAIVKFSHAVPKPIDLNEVARKHLRVKNTVRNKNEEGKGSLSEWHVQRGTLWSVERYVSNLFKVCSNTCLQDVKR